MREVDREFAADGIAVRYITIGPQEKAREFCARHNAAALCIGDSDKQTYEAMGFGRFNLFKLFATPALAKRRAENKAAGFQQDWKATRIQDAAQNPGAAVLDAHGIVRWLYRGEHPGDLPPMRTMLENARSALAQ